MSEFTSLSNALVAQPRSAAIGQEAFLKFYLGQDTAALLPLQQSAEVLSISRKAIVPIFFMPAWVTGVYNMRGEILWVIDLAHLLGLSPISRTVSASSSVTAIVLNVASSSTATTAVRNHMLGCLVSRLDAIEYCNLNEIQPPPINTPTLPFVQGYWLKSNQEMLAVLDIKAIAAAMPKPEM